MFTSGAVRFYRSSNQGTNWTVIPMPWVLSTIPSYQGTSVDPSGNLIGGGFYPPAPHIGTWRSTDGGASTSEVTMTGLPGGAGQWSTNYNALTGHLLVGTEQYCLFESSDNGATFTEVFGPDSDIVPSNPHCGNLDGTTYDNSGNLLATGQYGVWKATGGAPGSKNYTWTQVISTGGVVSGRGLGRDPSGNLYWGHSQVNGGTPAACGSISSNCPASIFRSTDGGTTWLPFNTGLPDNLEGWRFIYSNLDGHLYVAFQGASGASAVYRF